MLTSALVLALLVQAAPAPAAPAAALSAELPASAYQARRQRVMDGLDGCMALLGARGSASGATETFRQDGDFLWLTGVNEEEAWILLAPKSRYDKTHLILRPRDVERERWTGPRDPLTPALKKKHGVDRVTRGAPDRAAVAAAQQTDCIAIIAPAHDFRAERPDVALSRKLSEELGLRLVHKRDLIGQLRAAHTAEELAMMDKSLAITRAGHEAAARHTVAGARERDVQTEIEYAFLRAGGTGTAYGTIVGSGPNGTVLHWDQNTRRLQPGELVVVDAGAEFGRYATDITRTYPVSGTFSPEQARAYRAVYQAQEDVFAAIKPGVSFEDLQRVAEQSLERSGYLDYFIHGLGHFVGLDVHDAGVYSAPLPVGAVVTVEPGVYIPEKGFGIRIEDQVLITADGYRVLSKDIPRRLEDVEAWVTRARAR
jgi:Xaa-Pro aminopeptidase